MRLFILLTLIFSFTQVQAKNCTEEDIEYFLTDDTIALHCETLDINRALYIAQIHENPQYRFKPLVIIATGRVTINSIIAINGELGGWFFKNNPDSLEKHSIPGLGGVPGKKFTNPNCTQLKDCFTPFSADAFRNLGHGSDGISDFTTSPTTGGAGGSLATAGLVPTSSLVTDNNPSAQIVSDWRRLILERQGGRAGGAAFRGQIESYEMGEGGQISYSIEQAIALGGGGGGYIEIRAPEIILTSQGRIYADGGEGAGGGSDSAGYSIKGSGGGGGSGGVIFLNTDHFINEGGILSAVGGDGGQTVNDPNATSGGQGGDGYILIGHLDGEILVTTRSYREVTNQVFNQFTFKPAPEKLDSYMASCSSSRMQESEFPFIMQVLSSFALMSLLMRLRKIRTYNPDRY